MKEKKYRAWYKGEGQHQYLYYGNVWDLIDGKTLGLHPVESRMFISGNPFTHPDLELEEYTGLKDKLGNEIYQNDLIKIRLLEISGPNIGKWKTSEEKVYFEDGGFHPNVKDCEVVGNTRGVVFLTQ